jgi:RimJ/RimL family protein N-acetyltransferase
MLLRDTTEADLPTFLENQRDPEALRMAAFVSRDEAAFYDHWRRNILGDPAVRMRTIVVDGAVAGNVGSFPREGRRFIGYWIGRAFWGRGIASDALRDLLADHETTRPVYADVAVHNVASRRVLEKNGFRPTGERQVGDDGIEDLRMELER